MPNSASTRFRELLLFLRGDLIPIFFEFHNVLVKAPFGVLVIVPYSGWTSTPKGA